MRSLLAISGMAILLLPGCASVDVTPVYDGTHAQLTASTHAIKYRQVVERFGTDYFLPEAEGKVAWYLLERDIPETAMRMGVVTISANTSKDLMRKLLESCYKQGANAVFQLPPHCYDKYCDNQYLLIRVPLEKTLP